MGRKNTFAPFFDQKQLPAYNTKSTSIKTFLPEHDRHHISIFAKINYSKLNVFGF